MINLLSQLSSTSQKKVIEPREIFMSLPSKNKQYEYPRDVQSEVWKKWFEKREKKYCHKNEYRKRNILQHRFATKQQSWAYRR